MPPLITDEQRDDLAARRRRKEAQGAAAARNGKASTSAEAARDLLGGLITSGPAQTAGSTDDAAAPNGVNAPPARAREEDSDADARTATAPTKTAHGGEKIDQLIRRVRESTATTGVEVSATIQQRRPKGTADLAADAAVPSRHRPRLRAPATVAPRSEAAPKRRTARWGAAGIVLALGVAVLTIALNSAGGHGAAHAVDASASNAKPSSVRTEALAGVLRGSFAEIVPEFQALVRRTAARTHAARLRQKVKRPRARSRPRARHQTTGAVQRRAVATSSPSVPAASETQTHAPVPSPSTSQTSTTPDTSTPSTSRPAGPTGSNPLGGIGSCVKGC
jgi:hypothetical protein